MDNVICHQEFYLKTHPDQIASHYVPKRLMLKLHQCALMWSDECAHCDFNFDELKRNLTSSNTHQDKAHIIDLKRKMDECAAMLKGNLSLFRYFLI